MDDEYSWEERLQQRFEGYQKEGTEFFRQWAYTGSFRDYGQPSAVCEMCGTPGLRYHYLVAHRTTGEAIWVGSQCVLNFELGEETQKHRLKAQRDAQQALHEQIHQDRVQSLIEQLQAAYQKAGQSEQRKIRWMVGKYQRRGAFSPSDAAWLLQVMLVCGVQPEVENFPISLRTKREKAELRGLSVTEKKLVTACLTDEQKQLCTQLGIRLTY